MQRAPRERRSRDRYGRERRERGDSADRNESGNNADAALSAQGLMPNEALAQVNTGQAAPESIASATSYVAPAPVPSGLPEAFAPAHSASVRTPVTAAPAAGSLPKVQAYDLPLQDLAQVAQGSGLQWVNSDAAKIAQVQAAIALEVKPAHVPRERQAVAASSEGALVLVETRRDLREMTLPFEKPPT